MVRTSLLALTPLVMASSLFAGTVGYQLDIYTEYLSSTPSGATVLGGGSPGPDTGYFVITNSGTTDFSGILSTIAISPAGDRSFTSSNLTLLAGASDAIAVGDESSNDGGYNKVSGFPDNGAELLITGSFTNGSDTETGIALSVFDKDVHSGVFRTNPFGVNLDNYVIQGGDPNGQDTQDGFEESQTAGHLQLSEVVDSSAPEPASFVLFGSVLVGLGISRRLRS